MTLLGSAMHDFHSSSGANDQVVVASSSIGIGRPVEVSREISSGFASEWLEGEFTRVCFHADGKRFAGVIVEGGAKANAAAHERVPGLRSCFLVARRAVRRNRRGHSIGPLWELAIGSTTDRTRSPCQSAGQSVTGVKLALSRNREALAFANGRTVIVWDNAANRLRHRLMGHLADVRCARLSPDGSRLASGRAACREDMGPHSRPGTANLNGHVGVIKSITFSPDGFLLASASYDGAVQVLDARPRTSELEVADEARGIVGSLVVSALGERSDATGR